MALGPNSRACQVPHEECDDGQHRHRLPRRFAVRGYVVVGHVFPMWTRDEVLMLCEDRTSASSDRGERISPYVFLKPRNTDADLSVHLSCSIVSLFSLSRPSSSESDIPFNTPNPDAPCHPLPSLTFLLHPIALSTKNIIASPNRSITYMLQEPIPSRTSTRLDEEEDDVGTRWERSAFDYARVSLIGVSSATTSLVDGRDRDLILPE